MNPKDSPMPVIQSQSRRPSTSVELVTVDGLAGNGSTESSPSGTSSGRSSTSHFSTPSIVQSPPPVPSSGLNHASAVIGQPSPPGTGSLGPGRIRKFEREEPFSDAWKAHGKHVFVLSTSGKPVYARYGDADKAASLWAVVAALLAFFEDMEDVLRCLETTGYRFVFLTRSPLLFMVASKTSEPESVLKEQLHWLHHQMLSITTMHHLQRIYTQHSNYDLRRLLSGTEPFLDHLTGTSWLPAYWFGAVGGMRLDMKLRRAVGEAIRLQCCSGPASPNSVQSPSTNSASQSILYGLLKVGTRLITIIRPKKHSFHPSDLHLIFNMINSSSSFRSVPESWLPICLPKFNDRAFLHAYVSYVTPGYPGVAADLCLILVSTDAGAFFAMSECRKRIVEHLTQSGLLFQLQNAIRKCDYSTTDIGIPGLRHFMYKSKQHIQFTMPLFTEPYHRDTKEQKRMFRVYQRVRALMQQRSRVLKLYYETTGTESVFGWNAAGFELMAVFGPLVTKSNAINAVNGLLRWLKKEEESLFIVDAPTF